MSLHDAQGSDARADGKSIDVEALIGLAVHASPVGMMVVDDHGTVLFANREAERYFGFAQEELAGHPVESLVPVRAGGHQGRLQEWFLQRPGTPAVDAAIPSAGAGTVRSSRSKSA